MKNTNDIVKNGHITITITSDFMDDNGKVVQNTPIELKMTFLDSDSIPDCLPSMKHIAYQDKVLMNQTDFIFILKKIRIIF